MLKRLLVIALIALLVIGLFATCWFLWLDRYVVYTRNGAVLDFERSSEDIVGEPAHPPVQDNLVSIYYNEGDAMVETSKELSQMSGYYIDVAALMGGIETVKEQLSRLPAGTPVMLEVKNSFGSFYYNTSASNFRSDTLDLNAVDELIRYMNQKDLYTIACLPALRDYSYGLNFEQNGLPTAGGYLWADEEYRYWLDPTKEGTISYLTGIANELRALGFNEVVFLNFHFPDTQSIVFNGDKTQALTNAAQALVNN
jgi:GH24 family phage-related lysozyme (muramidase)